MSIRYQEFLTARPTEIPVLDTGVVMIDPHMILLFFLVGFCILYAVMVVHDTLLERRSSTHRTEGESEEYLKRG